MAADSYGDHNEPQYAGSGVPQDAADLTEVARFARLVGNIKADTSDVRKGLSGKDVWPGLSFVETDTGLVWRYLTSGATTGWVRQDVHKGGVFYDVIAADGTTQVQHNLGVTPTDVQLTPMNHPTDDSISKYFTPILFNPPTGSRFNVRLLDRRSNDWASGQQRYRFQWHAFAAGQ